MFCIALIKLKKYHVFDVVHVNVTSACKIILELQSNDCFLCLICSWVFGPFENFSLITVTGKGFWHNILSTRCYYIQRATPTGTREILYIVISENS